MPRWLCSGATSRWPSPASLATVRSRASSCRSPEAARHPVRLRRCGRTQASNRQSSGSARRVPGAMRARRRSPTRRELPRHRPERARRHSLRTRRRTSTVSTAAGGALADASEPSPTDPGRTRAGQPATAPGNSPSSAPGHADIGVAPGKSSTAPGHADTGAAPGKSGTAPGKSSTAPGKSDAHTKS